VLQPENVVAYGESMYYVEVCFVVASAFQDSDRASTVRRNFYRIIERHAWRTQLGWLMDKETCTEIAPKLEQLDKEYRELMGRQFISIYRVFIEEQGLKKMLKNSAPPNKEDIVIRLKEDLKTLEAVANPAHKEFRWGR
jgi:hypothetical protein